MIDLAALAELSARSLSREEMKASGFLALAKSTDLFFIGYNVNHWITTREPFVELIEYTPRRTVNQSSTLPRITVCCWEDQARLHRALGLGVVGRGEQWHHIHDRTPGLFDGQEGSEAA